MVRHESIEGFSAPARSLLREEKGPLGKRQPGGGTSRPIQESENGLLPVQQAGRSRSLTTGISRYPPRSRSEGLNYLNDQGTQSLKDGTRPSYRTPPLL